MQELLVVEKTELVSVSRIQIQGAMVVVVGGI